MTYKYDHEIKRMNKADVLEVCYNRRRLLESKDAEIEVLQEQLEKANQTKGQHWRDKVKAEKETARLEGWKERQEEIDRMALLRDGVIEEDQRQDHRHCIHEWEGQGPMAVCRKCGAIAEGHRSY